MSTPRSVSEVDKAVCTTCLLKDGSVSPKGRPKRFIQTFYTLVYDVKLKIFSYMSRDERVEILFKIYKQVCQDGCVRLFEHLCSFLINTRRAKLPTTHTPIKRPTLLMRIVGEDEADVNIEWIQYFLKMKNLDINTKNYNGYSGE